MIDTIINSAKTVAKSSGGNPVIAMVLVFGFYAFFNMVMAHIETLLFGESFEHWLDVPVAFLFMAYMAICVWCCAIEKTKGEN